MIEAITIDHLIVELDPESRTSRQEHASFFEPLGRLLDDPGAQRIVERLRPVALHVLVEKLVSAAARCSSAPIQTAVPLPVCGVSRNTESDGLLSRANNGRCLSRAASPVPEHARVLASVNDEPAVVLTRHH